MMDATKFDAIDEIIRQTVANAIRSRDVLRVNHEARLIAAQTGLSGFKIAQHLSEAGIAAGINMELGDHDGAAALEPLPDSTPALERGPDNRLSQAWQFRRSSKLDLRRQRV